MKRVLIKNLIDKIGQEVVVAGWVNNRRDHGKIVFLDLRDSSGIVQTVFSPDFKNKEILNDVRSEWVVKITGQINERPEKMINKDIDSGSIELLASKIEVLNLAKTPPFEINKDSISVDEEVRLKYRYLDLRTSRMAKNLFLRHQVVKFMREYLYKKNFTEIETPFLTKSTPEGAREYVVPSRIYPGEFYVLPQSPQQFKQLLMVAGIERYFQIVRCFRDEDQRGDRQPEFTQLDLEMSFVEREDVLNLIEDMLTKLVASICPGKKLTTSPFERISYQDSIKKYKTDKPDLRKDKKDKDELAFAWIIDIPLFKFSQTEKKLVSSHNPFTMPKPEDLSKLEKEPDKVIGLSYDLVLNGFEIAGGAIRNHKKEIQDKIFDTLGVTPEEKKRRFGHLLSAFEYGAPPEGGIAPGIDRIVAILADEDVIREVIAFPKTGDARDLMMDAPSPISANQLKNVHIVLSKEAQGKIITGPDTKIDD